MLVIYQCYRELKPQWLSEPNPYPGVSRVYGELLIHSEKLVDSGLVADAIQAFESFLETEPPDLFRELATSGVESLRGRFTDQDDEREEPEKDDAES